MAKLVNLKAERGDTFIKILYFKDGSGAVIDITGWTIYFTIKDNIDDIDADAIVSKTITEHDDPTNGKSIVLLTASETNALDGDYVYDIQFKKDDTGGTVYTMMQGEISFSKDVTRRT